MNHIHIYSYFLCVRLVTVRHHWPASLTNHIIWMNSETLFGGYFRGHTKTWRTCGMFACTVVTSYTHINTHTQTHFLHTRAPLKKNEKNFSLRPGCWTMSLFSVLCWSGLNAVSLELSQSLSGKIPAFLPWGHIHFVIVQPFFFSVFYPLALSTLLICAA